MKIRCAAHCFFSLLVVFLLARCAEPPTQELGAAEKALAQARESEASTLVPDGYAAAVGGR